MSKEQFPFTVPEELEDRIDDHVLAVHEKYQAIDLDTVREKMGEQKPGVVLINGGKGDPEAGVSILSLPHQQSWKESMALRSWVHHDINNHEGVTIVLPSNGSVLSVEDRKKIAGGDMRPFYEMQLRSAEEVLENKYRNLGAVSLDGYSLGGLAAAGIASIGSDKLNVVKVNSWEPPNKQTTPKKLQKDFMKSGGFGEQRQSAKDSGIPALMELHRALPLGIDYAKFGIASVLNKDSKALARGMANPQYTELVEKALSNYEDMEFTAGYITGSKLFDPEVVEYIRNPRFKVEFIGEGAGSHKHTTGDNIIAHALMMKS